jgi:large subunit ribosomal protein L31e
MAKKNSVVAAGTERMYTIPLRKDVLKQPRVQKTNRAVKTVQQFLERHMKAEDVKISPMLNDKLWRRGVHRPPSKIRVKAKKDDKGVVTARLPDEKEVVKKEEKKGRLESLKEAATGKQTGAAPKPSRTEKVKEAPKEPAAEKKEEPKAEKK